jgi:pimeloyl-ACP methyl ester carboxylesterase
LDDLAADACAALEYLRSAGLPQPGLFGHSEGGWVVLRGATRCAPAWVIANSCPGMTPARQDRFGLGNLLRRDGLADGDVERALATYDAIVVAGRRGAGLDEVAGLVMDSGLGEYFDGMDAATWQFLRRKQDHDPLPDLRAVRCPVLLTYGAADELVPVADSVGLFAAAACEPGREPAATVDVAVFPGANHRVQTETGDLAAGYLDRLTGWISGQCVPR